MGWEPEEMDIPIQFSDLTINAQHAMQLFNILPDRVSDMSGVWLGKEYSGLLDIMWLLEIEDKRRVFELLQTVISESSKQYEIERKARERIKK